MLWYTYHVLRRLGKNQFAHYQFRGRSNAHLRTMHPILYMKNILSENHPKNSAPAQNLILVLMRHICIQAYCRPEVLL